MRVCQFSGQQVGMGAGEGVLALFAGFNVPAEFHGGDADPGGKFFFHRLAREVGDLDAEPGFLLGELFELDDGFAKEIDLVLQ